MKKVLAVMALMIALSACYEGEFESGNVERKIIGNWQVVTEDYSQSIVEWGFFYVGAVKLYEDRTFKVNVFSSEDEASMPKHGTWKLSGCNTIVFDTEVDDAGTVHRRKNEFKISLRSDDKMVLEDEWSTILHHRLN